MSKIAREEIKRKKTIAIVPPPTISIKFDWEPYKTETTIRFMHVIIDNPM